jgi:hypothetical protein
MSEAGEFRLCSGCTQWVIWTPQRRKGPVYCCEACARGLACHCARPPGEEPSQVDLGQALPQGGYHALGQPVFTQNPRARRA